MMALDGKAEAAQFCYDKYQVHFAVYGIINSCIFPLRNGTLTDNCFVCSSNIALRMCRKLKWLEALFELKVETVL